MLSSAEGSRLRLIPPFPKRGDPEFFVRKEIGWALREYARTDPEWVRSFVNDHVDVLSPLSRREALKHLM